MDPNHSGSGIGIGIGVGVGVPAGPDPTRNVPTSIPPPRGYALSGKLMLSAIVILFTVVLLILFIHLYVRWHVYRRESRRSRRRRRNPLIFASGDHVPSSLAAPRGLDPKVLNSLAVVIFSSNDDDEFDDEYDADVAAECAVCLNEFEDGEKVRVLPRCNHRFHIGCIDMWFGSHNSCPLCRSPVEIESPPPADAPDPVSPPPPSQQCAARASESSSDSADREVSVEISGGAEDSGLGFRPGPASSQKSRMLAIMRFLSRDSRLSSREADLERGEGAERALPPAAE